jgi:predicted nucleic acid-binding protein
LKIILDASSLINLIHGEALETVLGLADHTFSLGPQVKSECGPDEERLELLIQAGTITLADDSRLPANTFVELLALYELGDGETECLAFADNDHDYIVCSDDGAARYAGSQRFGANRVIGSLFLIRECARQRRITADQARAVYELMKTRGGFLPDLPDDYFAS